MWNYYIYIYYNISSIYIIHIITQRGTIEYDGWGGYIILCLASVELIDQPIKTIGTQVININVFYLFVIQYIFMFSIKTNSINLKLLLHFWIRKVSSW